LRFYRATKVLVMSRDPTARCRYCGYVYYVEKLADHERICPSRPRRNIVDKAVRIARGDSQALQEFGRRLAS